jgi:hypothetical protein
MTMKRNVFGKGLYGFLIAGLATSQANIDRIMPDRSWSENAQFDQTGTPLPGVTYYPSAAAAGVDSVTGRLHGGSPLLRAGADGKDLGVDFGLLAVAQTGTQNRGA